jgi:hypothetical protein
MPGLVTNVDLIIAAFLDADYGSNIRIEGLDAQGGRLTDPAGVEWFGVTLTGTFAEFR